MSEYLEEDLLKISGIQHFAFCRRQWALIHVENQWNDNIKTVEGTIVHEKCHDENFSEKRRELLICRGMRVFSDRLGISGQCDVVEFVESDSGASLFGRQGLWQPFPIEYKRGVPKSDLCDALQLCAQALCLEEMLCCEIPVGYVYYDEIHRREHIELTKNLRQEVIDVIREMRSYYSNGYTPKAKFGKKCRNCSLKDLSKIFEDVK